MQKQTSKFSNLRQVNNREDKLKNQWKALLLSFSPKRTNAGLARVRAARASGSAPIGRPAINRTCLGVR